MTDLQSGGAQPRIYDRESLKEWLGGLPHDRRRPTAVVISARAALRILPLIVRGADESRALERLALSVFWATALARVAAKYPTRAHELRAATAANAAVDAAADAGAYNAAVDAAAYAAINATYAESYATAADAVAAAANTAADDIWQSTFLDVAAQEAHRSPSELASDPIWPQGAPDWAEKSWAELRHRLEEEHWRPWLDWYQRRLDGAELSEDFERLFATIPVHPKEKEPSEQNALLAQEVARIAKSPERRQRPEIPAPKPAAIVPIAINEKIRMPSESANADLDARALNAALRALKEQFSDLVASLDAESNIDKRATASLRRVADLIPTKRPTQERLFRLGHEQEKLDAYAASVVEEWPDALAAEYLAVTRAFDRTLRQFPSVRKFRANAAKDRLNAEEREATPRIAAEFAASLREEEAAQFVEQEIARIVEEMASRLAAENDVESSRSDPIAAGARLLAEDLVTSIENIVKAIAEAAISAKGGAASAAKRAGKNFASHAEKSIVKEAGRLGDGVGPALTKWAKRALLGAQVTGAGYAGVKSGAIALVIDKLMHQFPQVAEWLRPILDFLA